MDLIDMARIPDPRDGQPTSPRAVHEQCSECGVPVERQPALLRQLRQPPPARERSRRSLPRAGARRVAGRATGPTARRPARRSDSGSALIIALLPLAIALGIVLGRSSVGGDAQLISALRAQRPEIVTVSGVSGRSVSSARREARGRSGLSEPIVAGASHPRSNRGSQHSSPIHTHGRRPPPERREAQPRGTGDQADPEIDRQELCELPAEPAEFNLDPVKLDAADKDRSGDRAAGTRSSDCSKERERLTERFALMQSELGGVFYEMAIRDHVKMDVLIDRAAALAARRHRARAGRASARGSATSSSADGARTATRSTRAARRSARSAQVPLSAK